MAEPLPRNRVACNRCGSIIESTHPWEAVTCACGDVTVSGGRQRPHRGLRANPGSGWSLIEDEGEEDGEQDDEDDGGPDGGDPSART